MLIEINYMTSQVSKFPNLHKSFPIASGTMLITLEHQAQQVATTKKAKMIKTHKNRKFTSLGRYTTR